MSQFLGNYRATVVDNVDVDDNGNPVTSGRVKVRVPKVHGPDVPDEALPWAHYSDPFMGGLDDVGSILIPEVGAMVWVFFEAGDHDQPVYFAGAHSKNGLPSEKSEEGTYPTKKVIKTKAGFIFEIDDTEGQTKLKITQPNGNIKESDHEGNVAETIVGDVVETFQKNVTQNITETLIIDVEGEGGVKIFAPTIQLGEDADVEPSVLGDQLKNWINSELIPWMNSHQHVGNLGSPTSAPVSQFQAGSAADGGSVYSTKNKNQ